MIKTKSLLILISTLLFSNYYLSFSQELTITTYYPSPVGIYKELRAKRMAIGDNYYNPSSYCWEGSCTTSIDDNADLVVEGRVGIGTNDPEKELHVAGDTKIENDLNVDGGVAVGDVTNMGPGTINAQKIYVNGKEISGEAGAVCGWTPGASCPAGYTQVTDPSSGKSYTLGSYLGTVYVPYGVDKVACCRQAFPTTEYAVSKGRYCPTGSCVTCSTRCEGSESCCACWTTSPSSCHVCSSAMDVNPFIVHCYTAGYIYCCPSQ